MAPGVIFLKHIPHGFYEPQMKAYFKQFGQVKKLRLSRSRKTGESRGFAYIQFADEAVAKIAAESMNNYLMFDKLLKCEFIAPESVDPAWFKGWGQEFTLSKKLERLRQNWNAASCSDKRTRKFLGLQSKKLDTLKKMLVKLGVKLEIEVPPFQPSVKFTADEIKLIEESAPDKKPSNQQKDGKGSQKDGKGSQKDGKGSQKDGKASEKDGKASEKKKKRKNKRRQNDSSQSTPEVASPKLELNKGLDTNAVSENRKRKSSHEPETTVGSVVNGGEKRAKKGELNVGGLKKEGEMESGLFKKKKKGGEKGKKEGSSAKQSVGETVAQNDILKRKMRNAEEKVKEHGKVKKNKVSKKEKLLQTGGVSMFTPDKSSVDFSEHQKKVRFSGEKVVNMYRSTEPLSPKKHKMSNGSPQLGGNTGSKMAAGGKSTQLLFKMDSSDDEVDFKTPPGRIKVKSAKLK